jgi:hypothetical protein
MMSYTTRLRTKLRVGMKRFYTKMKIEILMMDLVGVSITLTLPSIACASLSLNFGTRSTKNTSLFN